MKILYIENNNDLNKLIALTDPEGEDTPNEFSLTARYYQDFDHIMLPLTFVSSLFGVSKHKELGGGMTIGDLKIYKESNVITFENRQIPLSKKEREILYALVMNFPKVVTKESLSLKIWRTYYRNLSNTLEVHLNRLRKKLGRDTIVCIKGFGYRLHLK